MRVPARRVVNLFGDFVRFHGGPPQPSRCRERVQAIYRRRAVRTPGFRSTATAGRFRAALPRRGGRRVRARRYPNFGGEPVIDNGHPAHCRLRRIFFLLIFGWTFFEGETIVLFAAFAAAQGLLDPWLLLVGPGSAAISATSAISARPKIWRAAARGDFRAGDPASRARRPGWSGMTSASFCRSALFTACAIFRRSRSASARYAGSGSCA